MKIAKYLHSCLLIEEGDTRILIDPGDYSFAEKLITPEGIGKVDAVLITHSHADHCDIDALRKINAPRIIGTAGTAQTLKAAGLTCEIITTEQTLSIGTCTIETITAPHDMRLTAPPPESIGYVINNKLLHPGDSFSFDASKKFTTLALPVAAPWMVRKEAIDLAIKLKPQTVIPIHDGMLKDFAAQAQYALFKRLFEKEDIAFHPLSLGESLEI